MEIIRCQTPGTSWSPIQTDPIIDIGLGSQLIAGKPLHVKCIMVLQQPLITVPRLYVDLLDKSTTSIPLEPVVHRLYAFCADRKIQSPHWDGLESSTMVPGFACRWLYRHCTVFGAGRLFEVR